jgi:hypothetical protein
VNTNVSECPILLRHTMAAAVQHETSCLLRGSGPHMSSNQQIPRARLVSLFQLRPVWVPSQSQLQEARTAPPPCGLAQLHAAWDPHEASLHKSKCSDSLFPSGVELGPWARTVCSVPGVSDGDVSQARLYTARRPAGRPRLK